MAELSTSQALSIIRKEMISLMENFTGEVDVSDFCKKAEIDINWTYHIHSVEYSLQLTETGDTSYFYIDDTATIEKDDRWYYLLDTQTTSGAVLKHSDWDFWNNVKFTLTEESGKIKIHVSGTIGRPKNNTVSRKIINLQSPMLYYTPKTQTHTFWHILDGSWDGSPCINNVGNLVFENNNKLQISGDKLTIVALEGNKPNPNITLHLKGLI